MLTLNRSIQVVSLSSVLLSQLAMGMGRSLPPIVDPGPAPVVVAPVATVPEPVAEVPSVLQPATPAPAPLPTLASGDYERGLELGHRNGEILLKRLRLRTVDSAQGCSALPDLEKAVLQVTRSVRPPANSGSLLVRGFYKGYLTEIRLGLQDVRSRCQALAYSTGEFAGGFYGALACQVASIDTAALTSDEFTPLYEGWSGGSSEVTSTCETTATAALIECAGEALTSEVIESVASGSCAD